MFYFQSCENLKEEKEHKVSRMSYFFRKWQVLMWKNLIVRTRHWFLTIFEIVIPILLFSALAWMRQNDIIGQKAHEVKEQIYPMYAEQEINDYSFIYHGMVKLAYAPDTPFTQDIIKELNKTFIAQLIKAKKFGKFYIYLVEFLV